jgi:hypothetical protein
MRGLLIVALAAGLASVPSARADAPARGTIVVTLADGSSIVLNNWSLSYEYALYAKGTSPLRGQTARREAGELFVGKRAVPVGGQTLTINYYKRPPGAPAAVQDLTLAGGARKSTYKVDPPARDLLAPEEKKMEVMARSLDLTGETVTGTRRELCLLSYTSAVECGGTPGDRVTKVEFQQP